MSHYWPTDRPDDKSGMEHKTTDGKTFQFSRCDAKLVRSHRWHADKRRNGLTYVVTYVDGRKCYLHRLILCLSGLPALVCDHRNGDGLDNRRSNVRAVLQRTNLLNRRRSPTRKLSSQFRGVTRVASGWQANITVWGVGHFLGIFEREEDAARAYDRAATERVGRDARLNFLQRRSA